MPLSATITSLYDTTIAEQLWPEYKRVIYCSITGRPWGMVSETYIHEVIQTFGNDLPQLNLMIDRMTLFSGPSPMWQSHTPDFLYINKQVDPAGFLVYMLNIFLRLQYEAATDLDGRIQWRKDVTKLYKFLTTSNKQYLDNVNSILLMLNGEGFRTPIHLLPSKHIIDYCRQETLDKLISISHTYYERRKKMKTHQGTWANQVHKRLAIKDSNVEGFDLEKQGYLLDLMLTDLFQRTDTAHTRTERRNAKEILGIASPTKLELNTMQQKVLDYKRAGKSNPFMNPAKWGVMKPGQMIKLGGK